MPETCSQEFQSLKEPTFSLCGNASGNRWLLGTQEEQDRGAAGHGCGFSFTGAPVPRQPPRQPPSETSSRPDCTSALRQPRNRTPFRPHLVAEKRGLGTELDRQGRFGHSWQSRVTGPGCPGKGWKEPEFQG